MRPNNSTTFRRGDFLHPRYWLMWCGFGLLRLASLFPYSFQISMGCCLGRLLQVIAGKRQKIVDTNLRLCFPDKNLDERNLIKKQAYENFGISVFELAMCWWWKDERLKPLVEIRGLENLEKCLADKQPVILLSGHFTSLEIGGRLLSLYVPFQAMYTVQKNPLFDSLLYTKRQGYLADVISRKNTRRILKGIRQLIPTWYAPDQNFSRERNVFAPFFGIPTATITATARLCASGRARMLAYYPERKPDGSGYILWIEPPLENFPSQDEVADATRVNASIERFVLQNPGQYVWMHPRFKTRPVGEADVY